MKRTLLVGAVLVVALHSGCCRMCCWQRGGSFANGNCYPPQQAYVAQQGFVAQPGVVAQPGFVPQAGVPTAQPVIQQQTFAAPIGPCTCY